MVVRKKSLRIKKVRKVRKVGKFGGRKEKINKVVSVVLCKYPNCDSAAVGGFYCEVHDDLINNIRGGFVD